jgi:hypothetical protein
MVDWVNRTPEYGVCVKNRFKPVLKRKYGKADSGCGTVFALTLKSKGVNYDIPNRTRTTSRSS